MCRLFPIAGVTAPPFQSTKPVRPLSGLLLPAVLQAVAERTPRLCVLCSVLYIATFVFFPALPLSFGESALGGSWAGARQGRESNAVGWLEQPACIGLV